MVVHENIVWLSLLNFVTKKTPKIISRKLQMNEYKDEEAKEKRKKFIRKGKVHYYFSLIRWQKNSILLIVLAISGWRLEELDQGGGRPLEQLDRTKYCRHRPPERHPTRLLKHVSIFSVKK